MNKQLVIFPRGQLSDADRKELRNAGFLGIEADDPKSVVSIIPGAPLASANDMLLCALKAMRSAGEQYGENRSIVRSRFTTFLYDAIMASLEARRPAATTTTEGKP